jgi:hypothetical protein
MVSGVMLVFPNFRFAQLSVLESEREKGSSEEVMRRRRETGKSFQEGKYRVTSGPFRSGEQ